MGTLVVAVRVLNRVSGRLRPAAAATRECQEISLRDVLLFGGGLLFCLAVMQIMLTGSVENPLAEPDAAPTGKDERGHGSDTVVAGSVDASNRAHPMSVFDGARLQPGTDLNSNEMDRDNG
jgi:hypothetical protein